MTTATATQPPQTQYSLFGPRGTPYPGHPLVLAYLVMENFSSIEEALRIPRGKQVRSVFDVPGMPGSITNIEAAILVLKQARAGQLEVAVDQARLAWSQSKAEAFEPEDVGLGQSHADEIREEFASRVVDWGRSEQE